jgi:ribose 5-phosphate isomerase B
MGDAIIMASDHRGVALKAALRRHLEQAGYPVTDVGSEGDASVDYPDFAALAARAVAQGEHPRGIVICGSGLGVMYTANRFTGVRAALALDEDMARAARAHNDANMLALPADRLDPERAWSIVRTWLDTPFEGGRHVARIEKIDRLTQGPRWRRPIPTSRASCGARHVARRWASS